MTIMILNDRKELFSRAYVRAVASVAGYMATQPELDRDSVDFQLAGVGGRGTKHSPYLDVQIKCTADDDLAPTRFGFPLPIKNYDDLRDTELAVPRILIVVIVPTAIERWLATSESEMVLRHCGYWRSLHNEPATDNTTSITVEINRANVFDVDGLQNLMAAVGDGDIP
jgi:Domain of unknown function (DUF4365)